MHNGRSREKKLMCLFDCAKSYDVGVAATTNNNKLKAKNVCVFHLLRRAHKSVHRCLSSFVRCCCCCWLKPCFKRKPYKKENRNNPMHTNVHTRTNTCICVWIHMGLRQPMYVCVRNTYNVSHLHARPYSIQHIIIILHILYTYSRFIQQTTHDFQYTHTYNTVARTLWC